MLVAVLATPVAAQDRTRLELVIEAGSWPRAPGPIEVPWPVGSEPPGSDDTIHVLTQEDPRQPWTWLQVEPASKRAFLWSPWRLEAGESKTLRSLPNPWVTPPEVFALNAEDDRWSLREHGRLRFTYQGGIVPAPPEYGSEYDRGAYLHPLFSPSGARLTEDFPASHPHQRGLFFAWTRIEVDGLGADFWNFPEHGDRIVPLRVEPNGTGPVFARFTAFHEARAAVHEGGSVRAFQEDLVVRTFTAADGVIRIDLERTQRTGDHELVMPVHRYGGWNVRGPDSWNDGFTVRTSAGDDRAAADAGTAHWFAAWGPCPRPDGDDLAVAGFALIQHPENPHDPSPMRMNPAVPQCGFAPTRREPWSQKSAQVQRERFRLLLFDGVPDDARLEELVSEFRRPPNVTARWRRD